MQAKKNRRYVYTFIFIGLFSLVSSIVFTLFQSNFFSKKSFYGFKLKSAAGLSSRPVVSFKGVEIGRVSSFKLGKEILVKFFIYEEFEKFLSKNEVLSFKRNPLTGDVIEVELIPVLNPNEVYPNGLKNVFVTVEDEEFTNIKTENGSHSQGVDRLVGSVGKLVSKVESNNLIEKINTTLENTNKLGEAVNKFVENNSNDQPFETKDLVKSLSELKDLVHGLNKTNQKLYSVLNEVEKNKDKIGGILSHGENTLIQGQQIIEGVKGSTLLSPLIKIPPKDLKDNVFLE